MIVVIGDALLDQEVVGHVGRPCPDTPAPVLDVTGTFDRPGGAGLTALCAARDGHDVTLVTAVGHDAPARRLRQLCAAAGIRLVPIGYRGTTPEKTRVRTPWQVLVRLDRGEGRPGRLPDGLDALLDAAAAIVVSDYGRGVTALRPIRRLLTRAATRRPVVWDPHPRGSSPVPGVRLVTPNHAEAAGFTDHECPPGSRNGAAVACASRHAADLRRRWPVHAVAVTLGSGGALLSAGDNGTEVLAPPATATGDTCGAGDRFAATVTTALATGEPLSEAVEAAVAAATAYVAAGGPSSLNTATPYAAVAGSPPLNATSSPPQAGSSALNPAGSPPLNTAGSTRPVPIGRWRRRLAPAPRPPEGTDGAGTDGAIA